MSKLAIASTSVPGTLFDKLEKIADAGFHGVELHEPDLVAFSGTAKDIASKAQSLGLQINVLQPFRDFEGLEGDERTRAFKRLERKLALIEDLGAETLLIGTTTRADASGSLEKIQGDFTQLALRVEKSGVRAALLALPWGSHITHDTQAAQLVKAVNHPHFGLALNSYFSLADGSRAARLRDLDENSIFHVQLADAPSLGSDIRQLKRYFGVLPGQGSLNLESFVRAVSRAGYDGAWTLARVNSVVGENGHSLLLDGYRALVSLLDEVAKTEPSVQRPLKTLPNRVPVTGVEFIEFAVDAAAQDELAKVLSSLSFRKERQHTSKSVELWRQGAVNIVLNSETVGFAAHARAEHGPCVCDIGLRVKDAAQTVARATLLGAPHFSQPVGSGELDIPAIQGVGRSVVHFIDEKSDLHRVWDIEFDPVARSPSPQPAGIRRIDHLAQTMRYQDMQSWLTYYLSTLNFEKAEIVDVVDPSGLTLSQALATPEGEVRLNLNGAGEQPTFAGSFLSQRYGAGVQHIAFQSDDIFETSDLLKAAGFNRLPIPENYYADLGSRFELEDGQLSRLQAGQILYDRDQNGEYFQIYSAAFWGGFFFEIVERRGNYAGYGARNAPIRLAAQTEQTKIKELL